MPEHDKYIFRDNEHFELVLKGLHAGVYEIDFRENTQWWSSKFYELLGYKRGEIASSLNTLLDKLVAPEDRDKLANVLESCKCNPDSFIIEIQLRHRSGDYHWYSLSGQTKWEGDKPLYLTGTLTDIDLRIKEQLKNQRYEFFLEEVGEMAKVGGWEINLDPFYGTVTKEMAIIHDLSPDDRLDFDQIIQFQKEEFQDSLKMAIEGAIEHGTPFDIESKIITPKNREIWVRIIGKAVFDKNCKIIGLRGVLQDIDAQKHRELAFQASINLIDDQNKRLQNFAHIVSHNLRSYSNNLALTLSLMEMEKEQAEMSQAIANLAKISQSFKETLEHLNEIMAAQAEDKSVKINLKFDTVLNSAISALKTEIDLSKADIHSDFSKCEELLYIPAYLESILLNLLSNAIKYRKPDLAPKITIYTEKINGKPVLTISDNGLGIDLKKYGHKLFGMYKTFHHHPDAKGIGLYITKNQVESLGGKITVESKVNEGATFKVYF